MLRKLKKNIILITYSSKIKNSVLENSKGKIVIDNEHNKEKTKRPGC
jgi:hypothetical protein